MNFFSYDLGHPLVFLIAPATQPNYKGWQDLRNEDKRRGPEPQKKVPREDPGNEKIKQPIGVIRNGYALEVASAEPPGPDAAQVAAWPGPQSPLPASASDVDIGVKLHPGCCRKPLEKVDLAQGIEDASG